MPAWLIKFLFWPWFFGDIPKLVAYLARLPVEKSLSLLLFMLTALLFVRLGPVAKRIDRGDWPRFLQVAVRYFTSFLFVGIIGWVSISIAVYFNDNRMPVGVQSQIERLLYENGFLKMNPDHFLADAQTTQTKSFWFADYISVDSMKLLQFLFPPRGPLVKYDYISPGDLMIATSIISLWWTALVIVIWSIYYATRRILKI